MPNRKYSDEKIKKKKNRKMSDDEYEYVNFVRQHILK